MSQLQDAEIARSPGSGHVYSALLVHSQPGDQATHRVAMATRLAIDIGARLIGVGAEEIEPIAVGDPYGGMLAANWVAAAQEQLAEDLKDAEAAFRRVSVGAETEWRLVRDRPAEALSRLSRSADLIIAGGEASKPGNRYRSADAVDLVLMSGRPVLVVPSEGVALRAKSVLVAWKDTREARRAIADAMPLLLRAGEVIVQAFCDAPERATTEDSVADVVAHLKQRGANARPQIDIESVHQTADALKLAATAFGADLIVAGAYGHSRLQQWALGGVTRDLMRNRSQYLLLSH